MGCPANQAPGPTGDVTTRRCGDDAGPPPELSPALPPAYPRSAVRASLDVPVSSLQDMLSAQVPVVLAQHKDRPIGAPGRATYTVRRGRFALATDDAALTLSVPVTADISVCKPIAGLCLRYGQCSPAFDVHVGLRTTLASDYRVPPPTAGLRATKGCVIGVDVTQQLEALAQAELSNISRRIAQSWPNTQDAVNAVWAELRKPLPIAPGRCLLLDADTVHYAGARLGQDGKRLAFELGLGGVLRPAPDCQERRSITPLPTPQKKEKLNGLSTLWLPELIPTGLVQDGIARSLPGRLGESGEYSLAVLTIRLGAQGTALLLDVTGRHCARIWVQAALGAQPGQGLLLRDPQWGSSTSSTLPETLRTALTEHLTRTVVHPTEGEAMTAPARLAAFMQEVRAALPENVVFRLDMRDPKPSRVQVSDEGVLVLHALRAKFKITDI